MPQKPEQSEPDAGSMMQAWNSLLYTVGAPPSDSVRRTSEPLPEANRPVPVTVLSGFLGAGKTTLLRDLLVETELKVLAIVNDLAAVNIDAALVRSENAETIQLENGCACCVLGNDLDLILSEIGTRQDRPDAIVIEASGVSDPMGIAQTVAGNSATELDGILTLVDATAFDTQLADPSSSALLKRQLNSAHLVLLTKADSESAISALQEAVGEIAPGRAVLSASELKWRLESFVLGARIRGARPEPESAPHNYSQFASRLFEFNGAVAEDAFFALMDSIPSSIYRIKGWVALRHNGYERSYEFHAVGPRWRVTAADDATRSQPQQLIVIGREGADGFERFCTGLQTLLSEG